MASLSHLDIKERITNISVKALVDGSPYIRPMRMTFSHNDCERKWDLLHGHDAVAVLMHNTSQDSIVLVRQFRPPVHFHRAAKNSQAGSFKLGYTLELPAGLVDKQGKDLATIAAEECFEEAGYRVEPQRLQKIQTVFGSVGLQASTLTLFHVEVTDADLVEGAGGGLRDEGEFIDVVHLPCADIPQLLSQDAYPLPTGLWAAMEWFLQRKNKSAAAAAKKQHVVWGIVGLAAGLALGVLGQRVLAPRG